ncbi:MAG: LysR family transcriptional regulator [Endozoicomonas sp.]|uniref:LysR family transcriptional regulator n=1 Tax=Endozoicomonas sp. TaxID=1892382 RepID=UPI003D9B70B2
MDIRLLKQFVAVYEEQSISRAAQRSFVSQSALSNAIRHLEEELGCLLFNRSKRGVAPTREAEQLYPMAVRMIGELNKIPDLLKEQQKRSTLTLSIMPELPHRYVAEFLERSAPVLKEHELILQHLQKPCDARLILDTMKKEDEMFLMLWREEYVFCVHENHPLAAREVIELTDLDQQSFIICPPCEAHQRTLGLLSQQGLTVDITASVDSKDQVAMLLLANQGVSFLPEGMAKQWPELQIKPYNGPTDYRQADLAWPG